MASDLTLTRVPADLLGVLRDGCTPCWCEPEEGTRLHDTYGPERIPCLVVRHDDRTAAIVFRYGGIYDLEDEVPLECLSVRMETATGRAHVAWAVAAGVKNAARTPHLMAWHKSVQRLADGDMISVWALSGGSNVHWSYWPTDHHLFADLDPGDPRLLPDGSRWVDAEALARVAVHVLGGEVTRG